MINAEFFINRDGGLLGFRITGHSNFADKGEDIICSAVSSAAYMTVNTVTDVLHVDGDIFVSDGDMILKISPEKEGLCRDILNGFKLHMTGLEEQYPKNINVNYSEV